MVLVCTPSWSSGIATKTARTGNGTRLTAGTIRAGCSRGSARAARVAGSAARKTGEWGKRTSRPPMCPRSQAAGAASASLVPDGEVPRVYDRGRGVHGSRGHGCEEENLHRRAEVAHGPCRPDPDQRRPEGDREDQMTRREVV